MNSYRITLPDFLLTELYKDSLVVLDNDLIVKGNPPEIANAGNAKATIPTSKKATTEEKTLSFLGNNNKNISIIVNDDSAIHLQDDLLDILSAILSACKLNLADVAIVNMHDQVVNDSLLRTQLSPKLTILFGIETVTIDLPFSIPLYKPQPFNNCTYLQSVSLEKMKGNSTEAKLEKSKLWVCLKNLFGI